MDEECAIIVLGCGSIGDQLKRMAIDSADAYIGTEPFNFGFY